MSSKSEPPRIEVRPDAQMKSALCHSETMNLSRHMRQLYMHMACHATRTWTLKSQRRIYKNDLWSFLTTSATYYNAGYAHAYAFTRAESHFMCANENTAKCTYARTLPPGLHASNEFSWTPRAFSAVEKYHNFRRFFCYINVTGKILSYTTFYILNARKGATHFDARIALASELLEE